MALIELHPDVENFILEMPLAEISARGGVADLVEGGRIVIIKDYRLDVDSDALDKLARSTEALEDQELRRQLKKLQAPYFFSGEKPRRRWGRLQFSDPVRQAVFDTICRGDVRLFNRAARTLRHAHDQALQIFQACFAGYEPYRLVPTVRLTRTLFENLHWDDHSIDDDFHQARVFANIDSRPRIWHLSHRITEIMKLLYREHDLGRFAGKDPNEMLHYINSDVLGGQKAKWRDDLPKHRIAFEPGEVWVGESRLVSHQIYYGDAALVYMWFVRTASMVDPGNRFNCRVERIHQMMQASVQAAAPAAG